MSVPGLVESLGGSDLAMLVMKGLNTYSDLYMAQIPLLQGHKAFSSISSYARISELVEHCATPSS